MYDSIKVTRTKTIEHATSLIAKNDEFKAQLREKGFAIAALKIELSKLKGNSVNTSESVVVKPHHVIASSKSRNSSKNMPRFSSNDIVHNHYIDESKKKTQEKGKIFKTVGLRWIPTGKIFESKTTKVDSEPPHGSNTDITNLQECIQTLNSSAGTSINIQEEHNLDLSAGTPFNLKKERIKTWTKDNVISGRPRLHGIALIQEISA
ncbi:hypothetical protein Tco_0683132 [Tanacetum coccineum]|uniref:Uncharacterized protein n=1 Tax=Tanacetum coccineum TaxID=301880 RepID=A0ABQ4XT82_9ASTR